MEDTNLNRRRFLGAAAGAGAAAGLAMTPGLASGQGRSGHAPQERNYRGRVSLSDISIQLYTMRHAVPNNDQRLARRMLQTLGDQGYRKVELAGYYGWTPRQLRRQLDNAGLHAHSSHDDPQRNLVLKPEYRQMVEGMVELGQEYTGLAYYRSDNIDNWYRLAEVMNQAGRVTREYGIQFFYHNHDFEFTIRDSRGKRVYDILLDETDRDLVKFELDLYWVVFAGANPLAYLSADPERYPLYHVKDKTWEDRRGVNADGTPSNPQDWEDVGPGSIDFPDIFAAGAERGLRKYYVVEHDDPRLSHPEAGNDAAFITSQVGFDYLRNVRF